MTYQDPETYFVYPKDLSDVLSLIIKDHPILEGEVGLEEIIRKFNESFSLKDGEYSFTDIELQTFLNGIVNDQISESLRGLVEKGVVDTFWDEEKNDFVFKISE